MNNNKGMKSTALCLLLGMAAAPAYAEKFNINDVEFSAETGLGYNSNVYRAPSSSYIDKAQAGAPLVKPDVHAGMFVPIRLDAAYEVAPDVKLSYRFKSQFYLNSNLRNGNTFDNDVMLGKNLTMDKGFLEGSDVYVGVFAGKHTQTYVDRDTGAEKLSLTSLTNISNRYNYFELGAEAEAAKKIDGIDYSVTGKLATLSYDTPDKATLSTLDHTLIQLGGEARFPVMDKKLKIKLGYDFTYRDYSNRYSRDAAANLLRANGLLAYSYHDLSAQAYRKVGKDTLVYLDVIHGTRSDNNVGYNDYTKDTVKLRVRHKLNDKGFARGKISYSSTDYPNAFAFEDPASPKKTSSTLAASLKGEYEYRKWGASAFWSEINYRDVSSNDLRYDYVVTELSVGGNWKF